MSINIAELVTSFQPETSPLDGVKDTRGRWDVFASSMLQEVARRHKNPVVGLIAQTLKPTIDTAIAAVVTSKPAAFARHMRAADRKPRKKVAK